MPKPGPSARRERRRAEDQLSTGYGWPEPGSRRSSRRTDAIAAVLAVAAVALTLVDVRAYVPTWSQYPAWWVPLALIVAAAFLVAAGRMRR